MLKHLAICSVFVLLICPIARADAPPTPDDLQKLFTDGNYKDLIPKINKALSLKGKDAAAFNKYDLLVMKGDAALHLHSKIVAVDAFKSAAEATDKPDDAAVAQATAELIRQSNSSLTYTRKTKTDKDDKPQPIDIVAPDSRKLAFAALETDIAARAKPKVDAAVKSDSLVEVAQAATDKDLVSLKVMEIAADGSTSNTQLMLADLGNHASELMNAALDKLSQRLSDDVDAVNNRMQTPKPGEQVNRNVLSIPRFIQDVNGIDSDVKQISDYAKSMSSVVDSSVDFKPVTDKSDAIHEAATKALKEAKQAGY